MGSLQPRSLLQSNIPASSSSEQESKLFSAATDQNEGASTLMSDSNKNHRHHDDQFHHQISYGHVMNIRPNSSSSTHNIPAPSNFMYSPFLTPHSLILSCN